MFIHFKCVILLTTLGILSVRGSETSDLPNVKAAPSARTHALSFPKYDPTSTQTINSLQALSLHLRHKYLPDTVNHQPIHLPVIEDKPELSDDWLFNPTPSKATDIRKLDYYYLDEMDDYVKYEEYKVSTPNIIDLTRLAVIRDDVYRKTNHYRKKYQIDKIQFSEKLNNYAQTRANAMALEMPSDCKPSTASKFGENVFCGKPCQHIGELVVDLWAYDFRLLTTKMTEESLRGNTAAKNLFQLLWLRSVELGVGAEKGADGKMYIVVNFNPPLSTPKNYSYLDNFAYYTLEDISWGKAKRRKIDKENGLVKVQDPIGSDNKLSVVPGWTTEINKTKLPVQSVHGL